MIDIEGELRDLRRTIEQLIKAADWSEVPVFTAIRIIRVPAGGAEPTEITPTRPDRLRLQAQVSGGGPVSIAESPEVVVKGGWSLSLGGPPFVDDWPVAAKGGWYAFASLTTTIVVAETVRVPAEDEHR